MQKRPGLDGRPSRPIDAGGIHSRQIITWQSPCRRSGTSKQHPVAAGRLRPGASQECRLPYCRHGRIRGNDRAAVSVIGCRLHAQKPGGRALSSCRR